MVQKLAPQQIVESINAIVNAFDQCSEHFDVFKVETKADSSYMVVSGIQDRGPTNQRRASTAVYFLSFVFLVLECGFVYILQSGSSITSVAFSEELNGDLKNPLGLNQAEVIAGLALEMLASSKKVINPVTGQPFRLKTGKKMTISSFSPANLCVS